MSSGLTLIVLGQAYFINTLPNISTDGLNSSNLVLANINQALSQTEPAVEETRFIRTDYKYTSGVGCHKMHTHSMSWHNARLICLSEGSDLAIVNSEAESKVIAQLLEASRPHYGSFSADYGHVGFHDLVKEGQYETVDGKPLSESGFNEWATGNPNNSGIDNVKNCGGIDRDGKLAAIHCSHEFGYVCEMDHIDAGCTRRAQKPVTIPDDRVQTTEQL